MRARTAAVISCALAAIASIACEKIIHFDDFGTSQPAVDSGAPPVIDPVCTGLAAKCLGSAPGLRHPPCPKGSNEADDGQVYVYAWKKLRLGMNPDPAFTMEAGAYDPKVGYDLDCSDHSPNGLPVLCQAQNLDASPPPTKWQIFPGGIDNAVSQRVLGLLNVAAFQADPNAKSLDQRFSDQLEKGHGSVLTIVYNWNGTPNDPRVSVRSVSGLGIVDGSDPKWDGNDKWIAATDSPDPDANNFQIPKVNSFTDTAYVADGVLVADFSFLKPLKTHIVNNGVGLEVPLYDFHMIGDITPQALLYAQGFGRWAVEDFVANKDVIAAFLSSCDDFNYNVLKKKLTGLGSSAADMPVEDSPTADKNLACTAISSTWAADAYRAAIGAYKAFPSTGTTNPCEVVDAGAD